MIRRTGAGRVLTEGAVRGRDDRERCGGPTLPVEAQEAVDRGREGAQAHQAGVDRVDTGLEADQASGGVAQEAPMVRGVVIQSCSVLMLSAG